MGKKGLIQKRERKRLSDLEIDEFSLVDVPAIGEKIILTKRMENMNEKEIMQKTMLWNLCLQKAVDQSNEGCLFCGITKAEEAKKIGAGLICSVCISCAMERVDKGVFDACLDLEFDFEEYQKQYPEEFLKNSDDEDEDEDSDISKNDSDDEDKDSDEDSDEDDEFSKSGHTDDGSCPAGMVMRDGRCVTKTTGDFDSKKIKKQTPLDDADLETNRKRQRQRSKQFGIEIVDGSPLTFQKGDPRKLSDYGDPVNLKFPIDKKNRAANARVRFKQFADSIYSKEKSQRIVHNRIVKVELSLGIKPKFDTEDPLDSLLDSDIKDTLKNIKKKGSSKMNSKDAKKLQKNIDELREMLERSLGLHDSAAAALNEIVMINVASLEALAASVGASVKGNKDLHSEFIDALSKTKKIKKEIKKAGAKISTGRLTALREIAEKLSELIESVGPTKKNSKEVSKSNSDDESDETTELVKTLTDTVDTLKDLLAKSNKGNGKAIEALTKRFDDLEVTSGLSSDLDGDDAADDDEDSDDNDDKENVFKGFLGLGELTSEIRKRRGKVSSEEE